MEPGASAVRATGRERLAVALAGAVAVGVVAAVYLRFFPGPNGKLGHDFGYFFPQLLFGRYWFERNGPLAVPWFTPALGGGLPYFPNPVSTYYSAPQALALVVDPLRAVRWTLLGFTVVGYLGMQRLLRAGLGLGAWPALLGAFTFALNGFFAHRLAVGHLAFHGIMLLPWIAHFLVRPLPDTSPGRRRRRAALDVLTAGFLFAYLFHSAYYEAVPAVLAFTLVCALATGRANRAFLQRLAGAGLFALALGAAKLSAALAFLGNFPRSDYALPGFDGVAVGLSFLLRALFWAQPSNLGAYVTNAEWRVEPHALELGVSPVPALLALAGLAFWIARAGRARRPPTAAELLALGVALLAVAAPLALNVHAPGWTELLKRLPVLGSSSSLLRHLAAYVPLAVLAGALGHAALPARARAPVAWLGALLVATWCLRLDRAHYAGPRNLVYDPTEVVAAWRAVDETGRVPPIERVEVPRTKRGQLYTPIGRNDALAHGASQLLCYEPIFGYRLEHFPKEHLRPGPIDLRDEAGFNLHHPALFVFPSENGGQPGEPFGLDEEASLRAFAAYEPIPFERPARQRLLDLASTAALALGSLALTGLALRR